MSLAAQLKRARAMADRLPPPPLTSRFWLTAFERCGAGELSLAEREPDWPRLLTAYRKVFAVPGPESEALHEWLSELFLRAQRGVPPCSEAEFAGLSAWFRGSEYARRLDAHAWATAALPGGARVSLRELRTCIDRGPGRFGSGRVAHRLRELLTADKRRDGSASPTPA